MPSLFILSLGTISTLSVRRMKTSEEWAPCLSLQAAAAGAGGGGELLSDLKVIHSSGNSRQFFSNFQIIPVPFVSSKMLETTSPGVGWSGQGMRGEKMFVKG